MTHYSAIHRQTMLLIAVEAIRQGVHLGTRLELDLNDYELPLVEPRASFVTLKLDGQLRGSMGSLSSSQTLIENIAHNAYNAAFKDPRFQPLNEAEFLNIEVEISVLSDKQTLSCETEQVLADQLVPGRDGLILEDGERCATFLPSVWEQLPEAEQFVAQLKLKIGIKQDEWNPNIKASRYVVSNIGQHKTRSPQVG